MTLFTRTSQLSGETRSMEIPITNEDWEAYKNSNKLIQDAFPDLSSDQREFLMTGITPEEWDAAFKDLDEPRPDEEEPPF